MIDCARCGKLLQRLHIHQFHQEVGEGRIVRFVAHVRPTLLPAFQCVLNVLFGLRAGNRTALAVYGRTQIDFVHAVVHRIAANQFEAETVQVLGGLDFCDFVLTDLIVQASGFITNFGNVRPMAAGQAVGCFPVAGFRCRYCTDDGAVLMVQPARAAQAKRSGIYFFMAHIIVGLYANSQILTGESGVLR